MDPNLEELLITVSLVTRAQRITPLSKGGLKLSKCRPFTPLDHSTTKPVALCDCARSPMVFPGTPVALSHPTGEEASYYCSVSPAIARQCGGPHKWVAGPLIMHARPMRVREAPLTSPQLSAWPTGHNHDVLHQGFYYCILRMVMATVIGLAPCFPTAPPYITCPSKP